MDQRKLWHSDCDNIFSLKRRLLIQRNTGYRNITDHLAVGKGPQEIAKKWTDSEGNIWYNTFGEGSNRNKVIKWQELDKLSKSGDVMEYVSVWLSNSIPTNIQPRSTQVIRHIISTTVRRNEKLNEANKEKPIGGNV